MADPMDLMAGSGGQPIPRDFNAQDAQNMEDVGHPNAHSHVPLC